MCVAVVIPTHNAEPYWAQLEEALHRQNIPADHVLIIDSSSKDGTRRLARASGFRVECIPQSEFNHGGTRQLACRYFPTADAILFLTQDAIPKAHESFSRLCRSLQDPTIGAAYGRQIAREHADPIERHNRLFNYPAVSRVRTFEDRQEIGIRAAFLSNSFAVYRRTALEDIGGFPQNVILAEDSYVAARMLALGWKVAYVSDAEVIHSHCFTLRQEFARYFDIGVHHNRESWLLATYGVTGEGSRFLRSEMRYLTEHAPRLIPEALVRTASKLLAYRLGKAWRWFPAGWNRRLSSCKMFWK